MRHTMFRVIRISVLVVAFTGCGAKNPDAPAIAEPREPEAQAMRVLWTVSGFKMTEKAAWDEARARQMLFKPLDMDDERLVFDGSICETPNLERSTVDADEYLGRTYGITSEWLGVESHAFQVLRSRCGISGFEEFIRLPDRRIVIHIAGIFFFLAPAVVH